MIAIRDLTPADTLTCIAIFEAAWNSAFPHAPRTIDAARFAIETADEAVILATIDGEILGFAALYAPDAFLHHLYVRPGAQRGGVGSALLLETIGRTNGALNLKCQLSNTRARAFYAKHGFIGGECGEDATGPWVRLHATAP